MNKLVILLCMFMTLPAHADGDAAYLQRGQVAPFEGYLITTDKAEKVRLMDINLSTCSKLSSLKEDENSLLTQRLANAQANSEALSKQLVESRDGSFLSKAGFFVLGAAFTTMLAYGVTRTLR